MRAVIEQMAALERGAGSEGEHEAALILARHLERAGCTVQIDEESFRGENYARVLLPLGVLGLLASRLVARRPLLGGALAAATAATIIDDAENGRRLWRRTVAREQTTWNVVAETGDADAERTLVVLAHHDAAPTGAAFDPALQRTLAARFPDLVAARDEALPIWYPVVAGPVLTVAAAITRSRLLRRLGALFSLLSGVLGADIARHRIVPGANDNLSACGAVVALAERLRDVCGLRVVLASCGAEEVLQGGIYGFVERHLEPLDPKRTWVVTLDTIGCPELILVEGEGPFFVHDYDAGLKDLVARVGEEATGAPLRRGAVARASTDAIIPSRAGYPTALLASWEPDTKLMTDYHLMSDIPERLRWETVERAVDVVEAVAGELAKTASLQGVT